MLEKKPKNGDVMDGVLAVGARGFAGVVSPQMRLSRCRFAADCENIDATVWHTAGGGTPARARSCSLIGNMCPSQRDAE